LKQNINDNQNIERKYMNTPENDEIIPWHVELSKVVHNWVNPKPEILGTATIQDAQDGSGDGILTFPEGFTETVGWKVGDTLDLVVSDTGNLIITKK
jgi:hypothetical protein